MADTDTRSQRLQWIRDGSNWLVGISTSALVLSATYFYDRFERHPRLECWLVIAWILLIISALSGVFTSFSTWKNLKAPGAAGSPEAPLGGWLTRSYTTMMWTFLGGYLLLAVSLLINVTIGGAPSEKQKVEITLPSGVSAKSIHIDVVVPPEPHPSQRTLKVVLYPFIPEFTSAAETVKHVFEAENPGVNLTLLDLSGNYYAPGDASDASYVGQVQADVIELDSVFLAEFVHQHKIQELPPEILLPQSDLLANAYRGSILDGKRFGAPHWACRNFLFFPAAAPPNSPITRLTQLETFIGNNTSGGLLMDMKGKLTLGELYLTAAFGKFRDLQHALPAVQHLDKNIENDLVRLRKLCPPGSCRDQISHELTGIYGMQFARRRSKALIGYSDARR